uniref:MHC class II beta chain N-terminal domain-containing protein n=1 Tax=Neovison vison TaxID=452646 RepID=A0A8C7BCR0_NEOVI
MHGKMALWISKGLWTAAEMMILVVLNIPVAEGRDSPQDFVFQFKGECYFINGTKRVRLLDRLIYNREEVLRFDSKVGEYQAVTEVGRSIAQSWNRQKDVVERARAEVDTVCRHNYQMEKSSTLQRLGKHCLWIFGLPSPSLSWVPARPSTVGVASPVGPRLTRWMGRRGQGVGVGTGTPPPPGPSS